MCTLVPVSVGVGLMFFGAHTENTELVGQRRRLAGVFTGISLIAAVFFEAFIFGDLFGTWLFRTALPLFLIAAGCSCCSGKGAARRRGSRYKVFNSAHVHPNVEMTALKLVSSTPVVGEYLIA